MTTDDAAADAPPAGRPAADSSLCHDCGWEALGDAAGKEQVSVSVVVSPRRRADDDWL